MPYHFHPNLGPDGVSQNGNKEKEDEEEDIEAEDDHRDPVKPPAIVGQIVK